ncbi:trypsin-like peptidase domain-containing protein [Aureispira anguillae]|uniref:Trypsin-like peptidase domain-containing protein n=1 Tax=Aureispira anguillae TaxID=2864201 RepID=A0A915VKI4_9BACT|nr:trypsin-like peptidase domain-containing protein [Aureispira anguillae]BDS09620.1 trypsin-like peptidase domain-containing protein [Aureispira anguillae]
MKKIVLFLLLAICQLSYGQSGITSATPDYTTAGFTSEPLKVGDAITINESTAHPYNPTGIEAVIFEKEFYNKYSSYIKIYFKNFDLAPGDYVEIISPNTGESIIYAGQGKIIDQNNTMISDFWSQVLFDERVIVRLHSIAGSNHYGFDIAEVAYGYPQEQIDAILNEKSICGQDDKEPVICYNGTTMHDKGRAVCRLLIGGTGSCTGWLLGCDGHVMTNNHCIGTSSDAANTDFIFNYHHTNCNGSGNSVSDVVAASANFIKTSSSLDYTLVQLPVNPTNTYGYLSLSSVAPTINDRIYIVGHPGGRRKEITVVTDQGGDANGNAIVNQMTTTGIRYYADTEGGSSGSPVLDFNSNLVVAIHNTGGCTNGSSGRSDQLIAAIAADMPNCGIDSSGGAIPVPCGTTITSFPYTESFENTTGAWTQGTNDDFDWTLLSGATPSNATGPTAANEGTYYIYMEATAPNSPSKNAKLLSPCFDLTGVSYPELAFNYSMYGVNMGTLSLEVSTNNSTWTTLWSRTGDQGPDWIPDTIDLNAYTNESSVRIRFNGTTGSDFRSDIAIDAFSIGAGTPDCTPINTFPYTESFENTLGDWTQGTGDDFDWAIHTGATQSNNTGPATASAGNYYVYMEASAPNNPSKDAFLVSPCFDLSGIQFPELTFMYHMYGADMGALEVEVSTGGGTWTSVWTRTGDQGNAWLAATIDLSAYTNATDLRIRFNGTTGSSWGSDIAVDAVSVGAVSYSCPTTITNFPYTESFENTLGAWMQETNDDFDWAVLSGATPTSTTGPAMANDGTYYVYMEASSPNYPSRTAILTSPCFDLSTVTDPELTFDYHMYGADMGVLILEARTASSNWATLWARVNDQGNNWLTATIDLSSYASATDLKLRFRGTTGSSWFSDIAIDAFSIVSTTTTNVIATQNEQSFLAVAPNPFNDYLEIATNIKGLSKYTITNVQGQIVQVGEINDKTIQVDRLITGVYFISFTNGQEHITRKIVKQ